MSDAPSSTPAPSSEPATGRAAEERKNGYSQMATHDGEPPKKPKEFDGARDAGAALARQRKKSGNVTAAPEEIAYRNRDDGSIADEKQTVTLNRAADDRKEMLDARVEMAAAADALNVADEVDQARATPENLVKPTEPSQPQIDPAHLSDPAAQQFEQEAIAAGVDPTLANTLAHHPQARQALESEFEKVAKLQQEHGTKIEIAQFFARDSWQSQFPELAGLSPDHASAALQRMQQTNPARFNAAMASLQRVGEMATLSQHQTAQRAHAERQQFDADARLHDAHFERLVGPRTPEQRAAVGVETASYAAELGINLNTLVHLLQTNPIMRHSAFQKMMYDAVTSRMSRREAMKYRDKLDRSLPHVQRPGHTNNPRSNRGNENLAALAKKARASGSLKDMAALLAAKRRG
jgi:hypothetical protein